MSCPTCGNTWTLGPTPNETKLLADIDRRRVEFAMMYEALEAAERRIQADIDNWEYTMSSEDLQYNIEGGRDTLAKIKAALGRSK